MSRPDRKHKSRKPLLAISAAAALVIANRAMADDLWVASTSDWNSSANWSAGIPSSTTNADINNGPTAQIASESVSADIGCRVGGSTRSATTFGLAVLRFHHHFIA